MAATAEEGVIEVVMLEVVDWVMLEVIEGVMTVAGSRVVAVRAEVVRAEESAVEETAVAETQTVVSGPGPNPRGWRCVGKRCRHTLSQSNAAAAVQHS